jgi:Lysozyme like domain
VSSPCQGAGGGGPGTRYTFAELEGLWVNAGGPSALAPTMAAIALAESGGCTSDLNPTDNGGTQTSWGLWQISNGTHSAPGPNWNTGAGNAALAVAKWKAQGLTAWGTYDHGQYKAFLNGNPPAPDTSVAGGSSSGGSGSGGTAQAATLTAADSSPDCLVSFPSGKVLFFTVGGQCIVTKSEARGAAGAALLASGGVIMLAGLLVLAAYGLKSTGAGRAAGTLLEGAGGAAAVLGADRAATGLHGAGGRVRGQGAARAGTAAAVGRSRARIAASDTAARAQARQQAAARRAAQRSQERVRAANEKTARTAGRPVKYGSGPGSRSGRA